jgi:hypothetical protein
MIVGFGTFVVLVQCLCVIESRSMRGTSSVAVDLWILFHDWYKCSGCVLVNRGPCLVQEQWLYDSWLSSVSGCVVLIRGPCVVLKQWLYICGFCTVSGITAVALR